MKTFRKLKKGFTIVELVIVIAVIAILAAVLVPTFANLIDKANQSADTQLVRNLNTILIEEEATGAKPTSVGEVLALEEENGYNVANLQAKAKDYHLVWNPVTNRFYKAKVDGSTVSYETYPGLSAPEEKEYEMWTIASKPSDIFSTYLYNAKEKTFTVTTGLDVGNEEVTSITYKNSETTREVDIRTKGGTLTIGESADAIAQGQIHHYGVADTVVVYTANDCFHTYGAIGNLQVEAGKAIAEKGSIAFLTKAINTGVRVEEKSGKVLIAPNVTTTAISETIAGLLGYNTTTSGDSYTPTEAKNSAYEIGTLADLETFRDLVNGGFSFGGCVVKLTADITLNDGWAPIGEGSRAINATGYTGNYADANAEARLFNGEFDGNSKTISNLNNKGFVPTYTADDKGKQTYCYGFFGILTEGAKVHNVKFANVQIDATEAVKNKSGVNSYGDSVAALVGYIDGNVQISDITVSGSIKAVDSVGGIVGRWYRKLYPDTSTTTTLTNLVNQATITATVKAAGIIGYAYPGSFAFNSCKNDANISADATAESYADLMMCYQGNMQNITFDSNCTATGTVTCTNYSFSAWTATHPSAT